MQSRVLCPSVASHPHLFPLPFFFFPFLPGVKVSRGNAGFDEEPDSSDFSDDGSLGGSSSDGDSDGEESSLGMGFGGGSAAADGAETEDAKRLQDEFAALEQAEATVVKDVAPDSTANVEKAGHIRAQFTLWDALVEARIRMQPALVLANRLPQHKTFASFEAGTAKNRKRAHSAVAETVSKLLSLQQSLLKQSSIIQPSSEDDDDDNDGSRGAAAAEPPRKKRVTSITPAKDAAAAYKIHEQHKDVIGPYTKETLEKWFTKTNLSRTKTNTKKFRALDRSVMKQVEQVREMARESERGESGRERKRRGKGGKKRREHIDSAAARFSLCVHFVQCHCLQVSPGTATTLAIANYAGGV